MAILKFADLATTNLAAPVGMGATSVTVTPGSGVKFPTLTTGYEFYATFYDAATKLINEVVLCTATSGDTFTISATTLSWLVGDFFVMLDSSSTMNRLVQAAQLQGGTYSYAAGGGTANAITATIGSTLTAIPDGMPFIVKSTAANTGATTLTLTLGVTALSSASIVKGNNITLSSGDIPAAGFDIQLIWNAGYNAYVMQNPTAASAQSSVRQTVQTGSVDANGLANFASAGTGLSVNVAATATPITMTLAYGFGIGGAIDYFDRLTADVTGAWSSLTANSTLYLYRDRNISTGAMTYGFSALAPIYSKIAPTSPATDQHWFNTSSWLMSRWSGSAWIFVQRLFVCQAITGASTVTSVVTYALNGNTTTSSIAFPTTNTYTLPHNIGVTDPKIRMFAICTTTQNGWAVGDKFEYPPYVDSPGFYNTIHYGDAVNVNGTSDSATQTLRICPKTGGTMTNLVAADWSIFAMVSRNF